MQAALIGLLAEYNERQKRGNRKDHIWVSCGPLSPFSRRHSVTVESSRLFVFFFSSRRRHTRFDCDWSSDVCSSDLDDVVHFMRKQRVILVEQTVLTPARGTLLNENAQSRRDFLAHGRQIGRASCRERV